MYYFLTVRGEVDLDRFWRLTWFEVGLLIDRYLVKQEERRESEEAHWARWRVMVADFRNVNRNPKKQKAIKATDLIRLSIDDRVPEYHEIDIEAVKRRFGYGRKE